MLLRLAQGIGVGGEWGGAVLLSSEFGDANKRGFWSSAAQIGPPAGNLMANGVLAVLAATLSNEAFLSWGWRVAFLASALLVVFGLLIRLKLEETPVFKAIQAHGEQPKAPIKEVFTKEPRALVAAALSRVCPDVLYSLFTVFVAVYATKELGMTTGNVLGRHPDRLRLPAGPDPRRRRPHGPLQPPPRLRHCRRRQPPCTSRCSS